MFFFFCTNCSTCCSSSWTGCATPSKPIWPFVFSIGCGSSYSATACDCDKMERYDQIVFCCRGWVQLISFNINIFTLSKKWSNWYDYCSTPGSLMTCWKALPLLAWG
jgi:hypothetical protein